MINRLSFSEAQARKAGQIAAISDILDEADRLERRHVASLCSRSDRIQRGRAH